MDDIQVTIASDQEARACLALLPEVRGAPVELLIARRGGAFAGAAALSWQSWSSPGGFPTAIHVVPDHRRRGVGRRLLKAAADLAAEETDGLWSFAPTAATGEAAEFLHACGARPWRRRHYFRAPCESLLSEVAPRADRLRARGRIPGGLKIIPLPEAPSRLVGAMMAQALGGEPATRSHSLIGRTGRGGDRSQVLMVDDAPAGVILWRIDEGEAVIDARVVGQNFRGGWLNTVLLEAGLRRGIGEGLAHFRFDCDDTAADTFRLARRCGAVETEVRTTWYYPFAATAEA